jgi:hypothetical protein
MDRIISICGTALSGKDTLYKLIKLRGESIGIPVRRYAFADELKRECAPWIKQQYGIDVFNCSTEEKNSIRDFLVFHGGFRRKQSQGRHWVNIVEKLIKAETLDNPGQLSVVTDVRYTNYDNDECYWAKNEMNGLLVHVSRYGEDGRIIPPPNKDEEYHDPILQQMADYRIIWHTEKDITNLYPHVDGLFNKLKELGII